MSAVGLEDAVTGSNLAHNTRRMLQALDAYWLVCDGGGPKNKWRHPYGDNLAEHWWGFFERYRARVEQDLAAGEPE